MDIKILTNAELDQLMSAILLEIASRKMNADNKHFDVKDLRPVYTVALSDQSRMVELFMN